MRLRKNVLLLFALKNNTILHCDPRVVKIFPKIGLEKLQVFGLNTFGGAGKKKTTSVDDDWSSQHHGVHGLSDAASSIATPSVHTCRAPSESEDGKMKIRSAKVPLQFIVLLTLNSLLPFTPLVPSQVDALWLSRPLLT